MLMLCSKHSVQSLCFVKVIPEPSLRSVNCTLFFIYFSQYTPFIGQKTHYFIQYSEFTG